jgi:hypothetical protein
LGLRGRGHALKLDVAIDDDRADSSRDGSTNFG